MKIVIAGGRDYELTGDDLAHLDVLAGNSITELVSGGCRGVDRQAEMWAERKGIKVKRFLPDWTTYGKAAGPMRNDEMAQYCDLAIIFPGGRGTKNMKERAEHHGKTVMTSGDFNNVEIRNKYLLIINGKIEKEVLADSITEANEAFNDEKGCLCCRMREGDLMDSSVLVQEVDADGETDDFEMVIDEHNEGEEWKD